MPDPLDLVSVYTAANPTEAYLVKNALLDQEIEARVSEENEALAGLSIVPADVLVARKDEPRAREIIRQYEDQQAARAARPDWTCSGCGAVNIGAFETCDVCGQAGPYAEAGSAGGDEEKEDWSE